jgi:hypothetical protein
MRRTFAVVTAISSDVWTSWTRPRRTSSTCRAPQRETADRAALVRAFWRVRSDIVILGRGFQAEGAGARLEPWSAAGARAVARLEALSQGRPGARLGEPDPALALAPAEEAGDMARGAAAIGLAHMYRDLDDLGERFVDLRLV